MNDPFDPVNERTKADSEKLTKKLREREVADMKKLLSMVEGRRFIWRMMSLAGAFRSTFSQNALTMAFNAGQHNIAMTLLDESQAAVPGSFSRMQHEYLTDLATQKLNREERTDDSE